MTLATNQPLIELLRNGGVAVIRTDTLYGLVASANDESAVERVYRIKSRDARKSCIILLDRPASAYSHGDKLELNIADMHEVPTSFLLRSIGAPRWLLRQNDELAYRVPANDDLRRFLAQTGPLIAPSANPEGLAPAMTVDEAKAYFKDAVDMYVDGGKVPDDTPPSRLIRLRPDGTVERLR